MPYSSTAERRIVRPASGVAAVGGVEVRLEPRTGGIVGERHREIDSPAGAEVRHHHDPPAAVLIEEHARVAARAGQERAERDVRDLEAGLLVMDGEVRVDRGHEVVGADRAVGVGRVAPLVGLAAIHGGEAGHQVGQGAQAERQVAAAEVVTVLAADRHAVRPLRAGDALGTVEVARPVLPRQPRIARAGDLVILRQVVEVDHDAVAAIGQGVGQVVQGVPARAVISGRGLNLEAVHIGEVHGEPDRLLTECLEPLGLGYELPRAIAQRPQAGGAHAHLRRRGHERPEHVDALREAHAHLRVAPLVDDVLRAGAGDAHRARTRHAPHAGPPVAVLVRAERQGAGQQFLLVPRDGVVERLHVARSVVGRVQLFAVDHVLGEGGAGGGAAQQHERQHYQETAEPTRSAVGVRCAH